MSHATRLFAALPALCASLAWAPGAARGEEPKRLTLGGYVKAAFVFQEADPLVDYVGHSNGFRLAGARLEIDGRPFQGAQVALSIEGALDRPTDLTGVAGEKVVSIRDAWAAYEVVPALVVTVGQMKAPFLAEALLSDGELTFLDRSIVARGVLPPEGYAADGLSLDRQIGATVSSRRIALGPVGLSYAAGVFNGNGANRIFNDNRSLTPAGRVAVDFQELVQIGAAAFYNPRTIGVRPDLLEERDTGITADLSAHVAGARLLVAFVQRDRERLTADPPPPADRARGIVAQLSYWHEGTGLEAAVRWAQLDPSQLSPFEKVTALTLGLNYKPARHPLRAFAAYTLRGEDLQRQLTNDGLDVGLQLTF